MALTLAACHSDSVEQVASCVIVDGPVTWDCLSVYICNVCNICNIVGLKAALSHAMLTRWWSQTMTTTHVL